MTSKERVLAAINHQQPDRTPICATFVPEIEQKLREVVHATGDLGVALGNDMVKISSGLENSFYYADTDTYVCPYGITWRNINNETGHFTEIIGHPFAGDEPEDIERLLNTPLPIDALLADVVEPTKQAIAQYPDKFIIGSCQCSLFEAAWYLRGLETFMMDLACEEEWIDAYLDRLMEIPLRMGLQFIELGVDMVWLGDDIATQRSMMISPATWRKYFKPRFAKMFAAFKQANPNIKLCYHSCGNLSDVVDELIAIGLDVLNPIQPMAMEPSAFKQRFGDRICMYGALDVQKILPFGTVDEVKAEVHRLLDTCTENGGFILSPAHHIQSDTSVENVLAFYAAAREHDGI